MFIYILFDEQQIIEVIGPDMPTTLLYLQGEMYLPSNDNHYVCTVSVWWW